MFLLFGTILIILAAELNIKHACCDYSYQIMKMCSHGVPERRPNFALIIEKLQQCLQVLTLLCPNHFKVVGSLHLLRLHPPIYYVSQTFFRTCKLLTRIYVIVFSFVSYMWPENYNCARMFASKIRLVKKMFCEYVYTSLNHI